MRTRLKFSSVHFDRGLYPNLKLQQKGSKAVVTRAWDPLSQKNLYQSGGAIIVDSCGTSDPLGTAYTSTVATKAKSYTTSELT